MTYYHGGKAGLKAGDLLVPSPPHVEDGCPICVARAEGRVARVWEFRQWLEEIGTPKALRALAMLDGADPMTPIDPPSAEQAVYITTDLGYATFYAARSRGDLYRVVAVGAATPSSEDHFPTWTVASARVAEVLRKTVRLDRKERRALMRRWKNADERAARR